ncbi:MAG: L,D-transpeptidase family protein [Succinivibrio sp.]|nr:L,D-transpeptidase family protein [Succinivibrio sp.]
MKKAVYGMIAAVLGINLACAQGFRALPPDLMAAAVSSGVPYDEEFDYTKLKRVNNLTALVADSGRHKGLIDKVIVNKRSHQMLLMRGDQVVKKFWIALSDRPVGKKEFEGDRRTPEGTYTLDYIKNNSRFYKAFHISYPNARDIANARAHGARPGGMIMVHGQPATRGEYQETVQRTDWTNGCIALLNPDLDQFMALVDVGTPITINP